MSGIFPIVITLLSLFFFAAGWYIAGLKNKRPTEKEYRTIVESIHSGFSVNEILFDHDGKPVDVRLLIVNERFRDIYDLKSCDIINKTYSELFPDFDREILKKAWDVVRTGKSYTRVGVTKSNKYVERTIYKTEGNQFIGLDNDLTGLQLVESELKASKQKFLSIFNMSPQMAGIVNADDFRFVECNPAFTKITGFTFEEYAGKSMLELGLIESSDQFLKVIDKISKSGELEQFLQQIRIKNGNYLTCIVSAQKISFHDTTCYLFISSDIAEMQNALRPLKFEDLFSPDEIQQIQDVFAEANGVASIIADPEGRMLTKPSNFCKFCSIIRNTEKGAHLCRHSDQILGEAHPGGQVIQPCHSGGLWDAGMNITVNGTHIATWLIGQVKTSNQNPGSLKDFALEIGADPSALLQAYEEVPVMSEDKFKSVSKSLNSLIQLLSRQAYQVIIQGQSIRELKNTREKLSLSEQNFYDIYNLSPGMMGISRVSDGIIIHCNEALSNVLGYGTGELIGKQTVDIGIWKNDQERNDLINTQKHNQSAGYEIQLCTKSGITITCLLSARKIVFRNEECLIFLITDITQHKRVEEQITEINTTLEKKIHERTTQLEQIIKDHETFTYSVSHDLKSPLRHIEGFLKLILNRLNNHDTITEGYFEKIFLASGRMNAMIEDLLNFSRVGRTEPTMKRVDLNVLVGEVIEQFKAGIQNREIEWKLHLLPTISCDINLFKTVFENLISNALKYSSSRQLAIIEIGSRDLPEKKTEIFVRDNGVGFNMDNAQRLFGVFQRLHHKDEFPGTGIGLANVKQIIQRHGGTVRAEGYENEGAVFYITLPV